MKYYQFGTEYLKIENSQDYVCVLASKDETGITINKGYDNVVRLVEDEGREVSKACFENAFQMALSKFNDLDRELKANDPEFLEDMEYREHLADQRKYNNDRYNRLREEFGHEAEQFNL